MPIDKNVEVKCSACGALPFYGCGLPGIGLMWFNDRYFCYENGCFAAALKAANKPTLELYRPAFCSAMPEETYTVDSKESIERLPWLTDEEYEAFIRDGATLFWQDDEVWAMCEGKTFKMGDYHEPNV